MIIIDSKIEINIHFIVVGEVQPAKLKPPVTVILYCIEYFGE